MPVSNVAVAINGRATSYAISAIEVTQNTGEHEMAVISFLVPPTAKLWPTWTPIKIAWNTGSNNTNFVGYVHSTEYGKTSASHLHTAKVVCLGSSMPLKTQNSRSWSGVTASYIVTQLARQYRLRAIVDPSVTILPHVAQTAETDFAFATRLAGIAGYKFFVVGTTLYFLNPFRLLRDPSVSTLSFTLGITKGQSYNCLSFEPVDGLLGATGVSGTNRTTYAVDGKTSAVISATQELLQYTSFEDRKGTPSQLTRVTQAQAINTPADAVQAVAASVANNIHWTTANALLVGDPRLQPALTINMTGGGIESQYQGLWLVTDVTHNLTYNARVRTWEYLATAKLGRDQIYTASYAPTVQRTAGTNYVSPVLIGRKWVASSIGVSSS